MMLRGWVRLRVTTVCWVLATCINTLSHNVQRNVNYFTMQLQNRKGTIVCVWEVYVICEKFASRQIYVILIYMFLSVKYLWLLHWSCVSILRSVFSKGSSLFSSKCCVSFMLSQPFCLHLFSRRTAAFANSVTVSPSAVSLAVGKDTVAWK